MAPSELDASAAQDPVRSTSQKPKRFLCLRCQRRFARLEHLQRHERTHTQEKPFSCEQCDSRFTRSDLLIRHERLSHSKNGSNSSAQGNNSPRVEEHQRGNKRARIASKEEGLVNNDDQEASVAANSDHRSPLNALENPRHLNGIISGFPSDPLPVIPGLDEPSDSLANAPSILPGDMDFEESLENLAAFLETEPLSSYHFSSLVTAEQPVPFFSPDSFINSAELDPSTDHATHLEEPNSFSRFGSRLPSLQPEQQQPSLSSHQLPSKRFSEVSADDRDNMLLRLESFSTVPPGFRLPSRLALARYIGAYINGFHEHMPFLHVPTMSIEGSSIELLLAMAAVGAQYCFEADKGVELFHTSRAIATERIKRRDARLATSERDSQYDNPPVNLESPLSGIGSHRNSVNGPLGLPSEAESFAGITTAASDDLIQTAQALLILMAMATWAKHKEILREALAIQSILATLVRDDGLTSVPITMGMTWEEWARIESVTRTKFIVFCFFNLHCIVYNIPPLILNSELKMRLPCTAVEFKADSRSRWQEARSKGASSPEFQIALRRLFSRGGRDITEWNSSLGNYILIHAIIQQIFFVRQTARCRFDGPELTPDDVTSLEHALRNWQMGWKRNPESSLNPLDPNGPVAFNSTALLRLAYIRLNMDTGPGRALDTRDPFQVANALRDTPPIKRNSKLVRAVLHSAHALSIPIKIGIRLVAKTQTFIWSIQHSLCSLECAFLLSKWLEALSVPTSLESPVTQDEKRIISIVKTMLDETEFAVPSNTSFALPELAKHLNVGVLRVWATIFRGAQTWAIVDVIGSSLNIYANMLETT